MERANPCPTPESVYNLCDPDWVCSEFGDEFMLDMRMAYIEQGGGLGDSLARFAIAHPPLRDGRPLGKYAHSREGGGSSPHRIGKRILWLLSYNVTTVVETLTHGTRFDLEVHRHSWSAIGLCYIDLLKAHQADFSELQRQRR